MAAVTGEVVLQDMQENLSAEFLQTALGTVDDAGTVARLDQIIDQWLRTTVEATNRVKSRQTLVERLLTKWSGGGDMGLAGRFYVGARVMARFPKCPEQLDKTTGDPIISTGYPGWYLGRVTGHTQDRPGHFSVHFDDGVDAPAVPANARFMKPSTVPYEEIEAPAEILPKRKGELKQQKAQEAKQRKKVAKAAKAAKAAVKAAQGTAKKTAAAAKSALQKGAGGASRNRVAPARSTRAPILHGESPRRCPDGGMEAPPAAAPPPRRPRTRAGATTPGGRVSRTGDAGQGGAGGAESLVGGAGTTAGPATSATGGAGSAGDGSATDAIGMSAVPAATQPPDRPRTRAAAAAPSEPPSNRPRRRGPRL